MCLMLIIFAFSYFCKHFEMPSISEYLVKIVTYVEKY